MTARETEIKTLIKGVREGKARTAVRYSSDIREANVAFIKEEMKTGRALSSICLSLNLSPNTIQHWLIRQPDNNGRHRSSMISRIGRPHAGHYREAA
ncbi:MAG: hypothetical protein KJ970_13950 [Candidatus Eisenbacteria bacterium]|uniref:Uncharacterized protein n=1 Tax=Eiseniibacteriota bacterium TaxID=2212470 RepID=A0A948WDN3_UNCEI|nr:hypothetical protein [Candidatus Eisenbacteria bacterium]MBU1948649.1 hypothetical protein [Candidatus Eisenbacteria bacterium]MBU2692018.1 hypothetical protein [Candidatus Eisenbacteria bacterium]